MSQSMYDHGSFNQRQVVWGLIKRKLSPDRREAAAIFVRTATRKQLTGLGNTLEKMPDWSAES